MTGIKLTKHCLINGWIIQELTKEREKFRNSYLTLEQEGRESAKALGWFIKYSRKLDQAVRVRTKLVNRSIKL